MTQSTPGRAEAKARECCTCPTMKLGALLFRCAADPLCPYHYHPDEKERNAKA